MFTPTSITPPKTKVSATKSEDCFWIPQQRVLYSQVNDNWIVPPAAATTEEGPPRFITWKLYGPQRQITAQGVVRVHAPLGE